MTYDVLAESPTSTPTTCRRRCRRCGGCASSATAHEPRLLVVAFVLSLLAALPDALLALWLEAARPTACSTATAALVHRRRRRPGASRRRHLVPAHRRRPGVQRRFRDRVTIALEAHVARLQASVATIAHQERPDYLDRLVGAARPGLRARPHVHVGVLHLRLDPPARRSPSCCWCRSTRRWCCSSLFALPTVLTSLAARRRAAAPRRRAPPHDRLARAPVRRRHHRAARQGGARHRHRRRAWSRERRAAWERWYGPIGDGALGVSAAWHAAGLGGVRRRLRRRRSSTSPRASTRRRGDVLLVLAAGARLSAYIGATVGEIGFLRGIWMDGSRRLAWLEDYAAALDAAPTAPRARPARRRHPLRARVVRLPGHRPAGARRRRRSTCPPARWSPSSARTAPARPRW